jgi:predicted secreted protein
MKSIFANRRDCVPTTGLKAGESMNIPIVKWCLVSWLLFSCLTSAWAEDESSTYDRINLSADANTQVDNDTVVATLYVQREGVDLTKLANEVNSVISKAVSTSKKSSSIDVQTLAYQTFPLHDKQRLTGWRVRQSIRLESQDSAQLSKLIGALQSTLAVESMNYSVSPQKTREVEDKLITEAIDAFTNRANLITRQFGRSNYRLVEIHINTGSTPIRPMQMRSTALAMEAVAAPTIEAGKQDISITINGTIEMQLE